MLIVVSENRKLSSAIFLCDSGELNTQDQQKYLGLVVEIWASLGLDLASFSVFYSILSLFIDKIWLFLDFSQSKSWVDKMIQYAPGV